MRGFSAYCFEHPRVIEQRNGSRLLTPLLRFDAKPGNGLEALLVALRITTVDAVRAGHCCPASHPDAACTPSNRCCSSLAVQTPINRCCPLSPAQDTNTPNPRRRPRNPRGSAARGRGRGRGSGRPLEAADAPVINGLFAHGRGDSRQATPPEKENRRGDDVFMAQAELRALEALNAKLQEDLIKLEELNQTLEIEKSEAVSNNKPPKRRCDGSSSSCAMGGATSRRLNMMRKSESASETVPRRGKVAINDAEELRREVADLTERNQRSEEVIEQARSRRTMLEFRPRTRTSGPTMRKGNSWRSTRPSRARNCD